MSIDFLQEKIRKLKNPAVLELALTPSQLPSAFCPEDSATVRYGKYCRALLDGLKGKMPAVRFSFATFAVMGADGVAALGELMKYAASLDYYVLMDAPEILSPGSAAAVAEGFFGESSLLPCDGLVTSCYPGSDVWKPFLPYCKDGKKDIFVVVRTGNKSAPELQDLLAGSRLVHTAAADHVNRYGGDCVGKSGYSRVSIMASASYPEGLRTLRSKYPRLFLLVDGYDYPSANAKNCAPAFDKLGHGAAVCAGSSITCAWQQAQTNGSDFLEQACAAADRMKKNLSRYVSVL